MLLDIARNDHTGNSKNLYLSLRRRHVNGAMQDIHDKYFVGAGILPELLTDQYYRANGCVHHLGAKCDYFCVSETDCPVFMGRNGSVTHKHVMRGWVAGISHQHLYQHGSHNSVNLGSYIREFVHDGVRAFSEEDEINIRFSDNTDVEVEMDRAVSIALIIGELLTNAMKYAFGDNSQNEISVSISMVGRDLEIAVSDNGIGLPDGFDPISKSGFGMKIVSSLLHQLSGSLSVIQQEKGAGFVIRFPVSPT